MPPVKVTALFASFARPSSEVRRAAAASGKERRSLLVGELRHRVKNTLAVVIAFARQIFPRDERLEFFSQRLSALARAYDLIFTEEQGEVGALMTEVEGAALAPYDSKSEGFAFEQNPACTQRSRRCSRSFVSNTTHARPAWERPSTTLSTGKLVSQSRAECSDAQLRLGAVTPAGKGFRQSLAYAGT